MTTYSQNDLATRVLRYLNLVDVTETPSADLLADTVETITSDIAAMARRGIPIWNGSDSVVPQDYLIPLTMRLALPVGVSYGMFSAVEAATGIPPAERVLRELSAKPPTGTVQQMNSF